MRGSQTAAAMGTRAVTVFGTLGVLLAAWAYLSFYDVDNVLGLSPEVRSVVEAVSEGARAVIPQAGHGQLPHRPFLLRAQLPSYSLIVFGCYALVTIGSELFSYRDCDDAAAELREVRLAT